MDNGRYEDLLIQIEDDLTSRGYEVRILDTMALKAESGLSGVTSLKGKRIYILIDRYLSTFEKAQTLVEEYFHAISDLGLMLDYTVTRAHNNEVDARQNVVRYLTTPADLRQVAREYEGQPLAPWMLAERFGYPESFAAETVAYYRQQGEISL